MCERGGRGVLEGWDRGGRECERGVRGVGENVRGV